MDYGKMLAIKKLGTGSKRFEGIYGETKGV
jgi:hypothetical protein